MSSNFELEQPTTGKNQLIHSLLHTEDKCPLQFPVFHWSLDVFVFFIIASPCRAFCSWKVKLFVPLTVLCCSPAWEYVSAWSVTYMYEQKAQITGRWCTKTSCHFSCSFWFLSSLFLLSPLHTVPCLESCACTLTHMHTDVDMRIPYSIAVLKRRYNLQRSLEKVSLHSSEEHWLACINQMCEVCRMQQLFSLPADQWRPALTE